MRVGCSYIARRFCSCSLGKAKSCRANLEREKRELSLFSRLSVCLCACHARRPRLWRRDDRVPLSRAARAVVRDMRVNKECRAMLLCRSCRRACEEPPESRWYSRMDIACESAHATAVFQTLAQAEKGDRFARGFARGDARAASGARPSMCACAARLQIDSAQWPIDRNR